MTSRLPGSIYLEVGEWWETFWMMIKHYYERWWNWLTPSHKKCWVACGPGFTDPWNEFDGLTQAPKPPKALHVWNMYSTVNNILIRANYNDLGWPHFWMWFNTENFQIPNMTLIRVDGLSCWKNIHPAQCRSVEKGYYTWKSTTFLPARIRKQQLLPKKQEAEMAQIHTSNPIKKQTGKSMKIPW